MTDSEPPVPQGPIPGAATPQGTRAYAAVHGAHAGTGHYSDLLRTRLRVSSIGIGTFPGDASPQADAQQAALVSKGLQAGLNVIDTAAHYRYGRALAAVGAGLRDARARGVEREAMFLISKGGFLTYRGGIPEDREGWFQREILDQGLGRAEDLARGVHLISPEYINYQIELSRSLMGVQTLDAFLVDQPEVHIPVIGKEQLNRKLLAVFTLLERAVAEERIRYYGISTFEGFRAETDAPVFQSLTSMLGLAEKAAQQASGRDHARHHFKLGMLPYNQAMAEGFTRFNVATGEGNVASTVQAAHQLGVFILASHTMMKGHLAQQSADSVAQAMPGLTQAQRAIQFNRSTPGIGSTLVGMSRPQHLEDACTVMDLPPLDRKALLALFERA